jgi:hypothetical protein
MKSPGAQIIPTQLKFGDPCFHNLPTLRYAASHRAASVLVYSKKSSSPVCHQRSLVFLSVPGRLIQTASGDTELGRCDLPDNDAYDLRPT